MATPQKRIQWYLQVEGTEFGPFVQPEVEVLLGGRKLKGTIYLWRTGMENWLPATACPDFSHLALMLGGGTEVKRHLSGTKKRMGLGDKRNSGRRSLIATVSVMSSPKTGFLIGVCEDISLTGMQVILDNKNEVERGSELTLKVDPLGLTRVPAFQIRGKVMWVRAEEMRMGISFGHLDTVTKASLNKYIQSVRDRELAANQNHIELE